MDRTVIIAWGIAILIQIAFPIVLALWFARRYGVGWRPFLYGALIFFVFQIVLRLPIISLLGPVLAPAVQASPTLQVVWTAALAVTAGLFETVGRWAGYRWLFPRYLTYEWKNGAAFGLGHGGFESAVFVGLLGLFSLLQSLALAGMSVEMLQEQFSGPMLEQLLAAREQIMALAWYEPLWGAWERIATIPFHIAMSVIVLQVFTRGQARWFWIALGLHAFLDFTGPGMLTLLGWPIWVVEAYLTVWAIISLWIIVRLKRSPGEGEGTMAGTSPA
ncbi:MAG TPA: YhfC family intramembrane metalloprotease [Chloroflexi bacterium]|jgi:uncharacterized membrane protein YhfC|nr:YhfC family intramembrane metalloprotease [Chloroflexota bacterium]